MCSFSLSDPTNLSTEEISEKRVKGLGAALSSLVTENLLEPSTVTAYCSTRVVGSHYWSGRTFCDVGTLVYIQTNMVATTHMWLHSI